MHVGPRTRSMGQYRNNRLPHDMSMNNVNPSPRLTKIVTTIIIRRRNPASRRRGVLSAANGQGRAPYSLPNTQPQRSRHGQRGAHPADIHTFAGQSQNKMVLPSQLPRGNHRNQPALPELSGMSNAQLPVIDQRGSGPSGTGIGNAQTLYNNVGTGLGSANNNGFGKNSNPNPAVPGRRVINELMNRGLAKVLLSGIVDILANPQNPKISSPLAIPSTAAIANIHAHNLHNNNVGQTGSNSHVRPPAMPLDSHVRPPVMPLVLTTMEPGEDPPEI